MNNFAFIDAHNVYRATKSAGWQLDWAKLYTYLRDKYKIKRTYIFLGYLPENEDLYRRLKRIGYELIFKEAIFVSGKVKANVDAELVLQSMIDYSEYDQALLLSKESPHCLTSEQSWSIKNEAAWRGTNPFATRLPHITR